MNILGIETSCDETAAAVVQDGRIVRSNVISSQIDLHRAHGGVVPELAARAQITAIVPVIEEALRIAGLTMPEADAIAVTQGPGLAGSLLVGVNAAKALAYALDRPLIPVNHLEAHVYANWLHVPGDEELPPPEFPALCLLVSGGHTELLLLTDHARYHLLGQTLDDAAGEAFDKGARLMGLGYPGGPAIQRAAAGGDAMAFALPRAWLGESDDFSFSGLKTALLRVVEPYRLPDPGPAPVSDGPFPIHRPPTFRPDLPITDLTASFEEAIVEVLAVKTARAAKRTAAKSVLLAGGVAANRALRQRLVIEVESAFAGEPVPPVRWPLIALCTDNGAMVAGLAFHRFTPEAPRDLRVDAHPRFPVAVSRTESGSRS
jgi:N6-L-threonylcarbamoyladenine synthase